MISVMRDGTAETGAGDQILRHKRGQGNLNFLCSADHEQDWQPFPVDPHSCYMCDHTYIHMREAFLSSTPRDIIYICIYIVCSLSFTPALKGFCTSRPHRQFAASLSRVFPLEYLALSPRVYMGTLLLHLMAWSYKPRHARTSLSHVRKGSHVTPSLNGHVLMPRHRSAYLSPITRGNNASRSGELIHRSCISRLFTRTRGHRSTGLEHIFSALVKSISAVVRKTIHGQRHTHCPLSRENSRFVSYSHYIAVVIPHTALFARSSSIITSCTSPCTHIHDY